jgi:nicotinamide mononucleotide transporter
VLNWPAGLIGVSAYLFLFWREKLYADMVLQIFFIAQGIYGWIHWKKSSVKDQELLVEMLPGRSRVFHVAAVIVITLLWGQALTQYTDASLPFMDAFAATTSFVANWLMARKKIESWILWITADAVYMGLFGYKQLYLSCGIYLVFLILAITGLMKWRKKYLDMASR